MRLKKLLAVLGKTNFDFPDKDITSITCDSRTLEPGAVFVAIGGEKADGNDFILAAINKGARCVVSSRRINNRVSKGVPAVIYKDTRKALALLAAEFYSHPSRKVKTVAVTGTNGKTTVTYLIRSILNEARLSSGLIGTVNYYIKNKALPAINTTPPSVELQSLLKKMAGAGCEYCVMEVSSHSLSQKRVFGIDFVSAVFTNLTQDHLDYHKNMENYFLAKSELFKRLSRQSYGIINFDSPYGSRLKALCEGKVITYGIDRRANVRATDLSMSLEGSRFRLEAKNYSREIKTPLVGKHNISNILAAAAFAMSRNIGARQIKNGIEKFKGVRGRMERVGGSGIFIDYAHTPDALESVLRCLKSFSKGRLVVVFGCGGERDRAKRPIMGNIAGRLADFAIITSDNPRAEEPRDIADEIVAGIRGKNYKVILDRRQAIKYALSKSRISDIILIAGKGHEDYQVIKDKTIAFNDLKVVQECL